MPSSYQRTSAKLSKVELLKSRCIGVTEQSEEQKGKVHKYSNAGNGWGPQL